MTLYVGQKVVYTGKHYCHSPLLIGWKGWVVGITEYTVYVNFPHHSNWHTFLENVEPVEKQLTFIFKE